ncbi:MULTISPECIES: hypothetical protein [Pantoea]|jgi:uncharacterized protein YdcH (DUF465 family)|uniref:hypothetical protein n=1 Tax=Pantoea TaxID=53335 RepID=UPI000EA2CAFB|nr:MULTISPECIES: hypothetical protein [Pantoea]MBZ6387966.1 hypothetical protein [Pantoea piersonii]MBZ6400505.1 hypothetical protein [Pantoea piersonii]MBZ6408998.1 hypothetical protein [Pantoea piersonii]MBZ6428565.1 hypothetical protein [Pantoea piersonii]NYB00905.1 hypothetical protein [Pantoea piersonii]
MERLTQRVERLELDTHQIKTDLAVLTERSQNFATRTDVEGLRAEQLKLRCEMHDSFAQTTAQFARIDEKFVRIDERFGRIDARFDRMDEKFERIDMKFERVDEKFDRLNDRITWTLMVPATLAVLGWLAKEVLVKMS